MDNTNYQEMVFVILENMTIRELSRKIGATERAVKGWKKGATPQNLFIRETIKSLYRAAKEENNA